MTNLREQIKPATPIEIRKFHFSDPEKKCYEVIKDIAESHWVDDCTDAFWDDRNKIWTIMFVNSTKTDGGIIDDIVYWIEHQWDRWMESQGYIYRSDTNG